MQSPEVKDLFTALSKAQGEISAAKKDSVNSFFKDRNNKEHHYADLESVWDAVRAPLAKHGLCVIQTVSYHQTVSGQAGVTGLLTTLGHSSGQWIDSFYPLNPIKNDPQGMGSAITYARRYALAAMLGVVQADDDGEVAMNRPKLPGGQPAPQVFPDQPSNGDGYEPTGYRIPFGKFNRKTLDEVDTGELRSYVTYLENKAHKDGKAITGVVADFIERASSHIVAIENFEPGGSG